MYDNILLSLYDVLEEKKKYPSNKYDYEEQKEKDELYALIMKVLQELEKSFEDIDYAQSFLAKGEDQYVNLSTFAFTMTE